MQRLFNLGLTRKQVQVIWFKEAQGHPTDSSFITYPDSLKLKFKMALRIAKNYFPNAKLAYLSDRIYAGYATTNLNPEPFSYFTGWCVKRLIEDQINGDTSLSYTGVNPRVPWLSWGPDLWADGLTGRSDGLTWVCPDDYNTDGTHPSAAGRQKVANMLFDFFSTDSTATLWFLAQVSTGNTSNALAESNGISIHPNPASSEITISLPGKNFDLIIRDVMGRIIFKCDQINSQLIIDTGLFPDGIYFLTLGQQEVDVIVTRKLIKRS